MLNITNEKSKNSIVLHCQGKMFRGEAVSTLMQAVLNADNYRTISLECSAVEAIDAGGLSALMELRHWSRARGIRFRLLAPSRFMYGILRLTRLDRILEISWQGAEDGVAENVAVGVSATPSGFARHYEHACR